MVSTISARGGDRDGSEEHKSCLREFALFAKAIKDVGLFAMITVVLLALYSWLRELLRNAALH